MSLKKSVQQERVAILERASMVPAEMSLQEIAEELGLSRAGVQLLLITGLLKARRLLEARGLTADMLLPNVHGSGGYSTSPRHME